MIFSADSTIRFSVDRGFSESVFVLCPVCWNLSIKLIQWEDGTEEVLECAVCRRREETMK